MNVVKTHHVDSSEPDVDGTHDLYYSYDMYQFSEGDISLIARCYDGEPGAHFLRIEIAGTARGLSRDDLMTPLFVASEEYLRCEGKTIVRWLADDGYQDVKLVSCPRPARAASRLALVLFILVAWLGLATLRECKDGTASAQPSPTNPATVVVRQRSGAGDGRFAVDAAASDVDGQMPLRANRLRP